MSRRFHLSHGSDEIVADVSGDGLVTIDGRVYHVTPAGPGRYRVTTESGHGRLVAVAGPAHACWIASDGRVEELTVDASPRRAAGARGAEAGMTAPMPATVVKVMVAPGDPVTAGAPVVVLEAMKMELTIRASKDGVVRAVSCTVGEIVAPGATLVEIDG